VLPDLIDPSGQCQAYLPYGQEGLLVQAIDVDKATGLVASRHAPDRYRDGGRDQARRSPRERGESAIKPAAEALPYSNQPLTSTTTCTVPADWPE